jgi:hypothetical protein
MKEGEGVAKPLKLSSYFIVDLSSLSGIDGGATFLLL